MPDQAEFEPLSVAPKTNTDIVDKYNNMTPVYTGSQKLEADFDQAWNGTAIGWAYGALRKLEIENEHWGEAPTSKEELNKQFPNLEKKFSEPMNVYVAGEIAQRQYERQRLSEISSNGPQSFLYKTASFGAGILAHAMDPLEFGAGKLVAGAVEAGYMGATIAKAAKGGFGVAGEFGAAAAEGVVANVPLELAQASQAYSENRDYHLDEAAMNMVLGSLGFATISTGLKVAVGTAIGAVRRFLKPNEVEALHTGTVGTLLNDKRPITGEALEQAESRRSELNPNVDPETVNNTNSYMKSDSSKIDSSSYADQKLSEPSKPLPTLEELKTSNQEALKQVNTLKETEHFIDPDELKQLSDLERHNEIVPHEEKAWEMAFDCVSGVLK